MPKSGTLIGHITEELGELGKKVVTETAKVPVDIAAGVFEKGGPTGTQRGAQPPAEEGGQPKEKTPLDTLVQAETEEKKRAFARSALAYLAGRTKKPPEPSVYERMQRERKERERRKEEQAARIAFQTLPNTGSKPKPGAAFIARQQAGSETKVNVRQE